MSLLFAFMTLVAAGLIAGHSSLVAAVESEILLPPEKPLEVIDSTSQILCTFKVKMIYVYFENDTALSYPAKLLRKLNNCGISYISLRNKHQLAPVEVINDDGILMFLVIVLLDASQPIDLSMVTKQSAAKHRSHILLIVADASEISANWLQQSFREFWRIWMLNVVIIYWRNERLQIYRYTPFREDMLIKVSARNHQQLWQHHLPGRAELFPPRLPNMHRHPLRFCMYHDDVRAIFDEQGHLIGGSDKLMMEYLTQRLNASIIVDQKSAFGKKSADVCFHEIHRNLDDMAFNIRFLSATTFNGHVEYTIVYTRDDLCVLVPKAGTASTFWNIFRSFEPPVWMAVLLALPLAYGFCGLVYRKLCTTEHLLLQLFASTLSMPWSRVPLKFALRLFFFAWVSYGLLISGAFRANLTSNLVFRQYLPDINTIKELALSPYELLMFARHTKHLNRYLDNSSYYERMIRQKMRVVPDDVLLQHIDSNNLSYAYLQKHHLATFKANGRRHSRRGRPLYHVMDTCLVPFHAVYIVPYGSPYLGYLNYVIRSAYEFGINIYWDRIMALNFIKSGRNIIRSQRNDDDPVVLRLNHFRAAFCLWTLGLVVAALVFLWEVRNVSGLKDAVLATMSYLFGK